MFTEQYEFLIDDLEKKLQIIEAEKEIKLIKGDLKDLISDLFDKIGHNLNLKDIEVKLDNLQKIDIHSLLKATNLFNNKDFFEVTFTFVDGKKLVLKKIFENLQKALNTIQKNEIKLGKTEILLRLEMFIDEYFQKMLYLLGDRAPTSELQYMLEEKLTILSESDIKTLWARIKEEFRSDDYGIDIEHSFAGEKEILDENFFDSKDINETRKKIARYVTYLRPKIIITRLKKGKMTYPIFFGIARILAIYGASTLDLTLNETTLLRIIHNIFSFCEEVFYEEKQTFCNLLNITPEGRIASLNPCDLGNDFDNSPFDFRNDRMKSYSIILYDLKRLLQIADTILNSYTQKIRNDKKKEYKKEDIVDLKPNFFGFGINLNALWRKFIRTWWKK